MPVGLRSADCLRELSAVQCNLVLCRLTNAIGVPGVLATPDGERRISAKGQPGLKHSVLGVKSVGWEDVVRRLLGLCWVRC